MKPFRHARNSVKKHKGKIEDYIDIHNFIDSSKSHFADVRHRALFHSSLGCFLVEQIFGLTRVNSDGIVYSPRDIAEEHILEDLGKIPSVADYLNNMTIQAWMGGRKDKSKKTKIISLKD